MVVRYGSALAIFFCVFTLTCMENVEQHEEKKKRSHHHRDNSVDLSEHDTFRNEILNLTAQYLDEHKKSTEQPDSMLTRTRKEHQPEKPTVRGFNDFLQKFKNDKKKKHKDSSKNKQEDESTVEEITNEELENATQLFTQTEEGTESDVQTDTKGALSLFKKLLAMFRGVDKPAVLYLLDKKYKPSKPVIKNFQKGLRKVNNISVESEKELEQAIKKYFPAHGAPEHIPSILDPLSMKEKVRVFLASVTTVTLVLAVKLWTMKKK